jgi:hypothetical protein
MIAAGTEELTSIPEIVTSLAQFLNPQSHNHPLIFLFMYSVYTTIAMYIPKIFILNHALTFLILLFSAFTRAKVVQDDWVNPSLPDYSTTIKPGETIRIEWTKNLAGWFEQYAPSANVTNVSLWFTATEDIKYQHLVASTLISLPCFA